jgi:hypothetical protein
MDRVAVSDSIPMNDGQRVSVAPVFRPAGAATIADAAFELVRRAPGTLIALSALANLPLMGAIGAILLYVRRRGFEWGSPHYFAVVGALAAACAAAAWMRAVGTGALAHASMVALCGRAPSASRSLAAALRSGAALAMACAARLVSIAFGLTLCVLPGIAAFFAFALAPQAVLLERVGVVAGLTRSAKLSARSLPAIGAAAILGLTAWGLVWVQLLAGTAAIEMAVNLLVPVKGSILARPETPWLAAAIAKVIADPLASAAGALAWVDGRIRTDGMDLDLRSARLAGEPLAIDPEPAP